jgi:hypothetical protein
MEKLLRAIKKCKQVHRDVWAGWLTPSEIILLCENGAKPNDDYYLSRAKEKQKSGDCSTNWFYFTLGKQIKSKFPAIKKNQHGQK